jgi:hypothetical protein
VTAIVRARVAKTGMPRAQRYGTEDAIEVFSGMLFEWIRCQPQKWMPGPGAEDLSVLFERIMHCKQNLPTRGEPFEYVKEVGDVGHIPRLSYPPSQAVRFPAMGLTAALTVRDCAPRRQSVRPRTSYNPLYKLRIIFSRQSSMPVFMS